MGGGGEGTYSINAVHTYVDTYILNIGFFSLSFEKISLLGFHFIHRYIIIKYRSRSYLGKIHLLLWKLWPLLNYIYCLVKNGFCSLSFEKISLLDSYFILKFMMVRSSSNWGTIYLLLWELWPLFGCIYTALSAL